MIHYIERVYFVGNSLDYFCDKNPGFDGCWFYKYVVANPVIGFLLTISRYIVDYWYLSLGLVVVLILYKLKKKFSIKITKKDEN